MESNALQRLVVSRLPLLTSLHIDKDGSSEVRQNVKWTKKSLDLLAVLEGTISDKCSQLNLFTGTS